MYTINFLLFTNSFDDYVQLIYNQIACFFSFIHNVQFRLLYTLAAPEGGMWQIFKYLLGSYTGSDTECSLKELILVILILFYQAGCQRNELETIESM